MKTPQNPLDQLDQSLINARPAGHPNTTDFTAKTMAAIQATRAAETFSPVNRIIDTTKREGLFMKLRSLPTPALAALAITVLLAITGTAYAAYHISKQHTTPPKPPTHHVVVTDPTAHWTPYTSTLGKFSLRYPNSWVQPPPAANCNGTLGDSVLFLNPVALPVVTCDSQINVDSIAGDKTADQTPTNSPQSGYSNSVTTAVTVDGVKGTRTTAITTPDHPGHQYVPGTKIIQYIFFTNGNTYSIQYLQNPAGNPGLSRDVSSDFDLMVTKTLTFTKDSPVATAPAAVSSVPERCHTSGLSLSLIPEGAAAGSRYELVALTNKSAHSCTIQGYPGASLVDANGALLGQPAQRDPYAFGDAGTATLTLNPNDAAYARAGGFPNGEVEANACPDSTSLRIYPPGETEPLLVGDKEKACSGTFYISALVSKQQAGR